MMRDKTRAAILAMAAVAASACADFSPYKYAQAYSMIEPAASADKAYDDGKISIRFHIEEKRILFQLKNRTKQAVAINWDQAAYIHIDGSRRPAAGSDAIFSPRRSKPGTTETKPGHEESDFAAPVENVEKLEEWTWSLAPMFHMTSEKALENKGKIFGLDLPIRVEGEWKVYQFRFKILNVIPTHQRV